MLDQYYFRKALRVLWVLVRLPVFTLLVILAPLVRFLLGSLALLGVLITLFWKLVGPVDFPFIPMLAGAIACRLALAGYESFLRLLSR